MSKHPDANTPWFLLDIGGKCPEWNTTEVYAFVGREELNKPYEFEIEFTTQFYYSIRSLIGMPACLTIHDRSGDARKVHGIIASTEFVAVHNTFKRYRCMIVPALWFLSGRVNHRIFQHKNVLDIIHTILKEHGFPRESYSFTCAYQ